MYTELNMWEKATSLAEEIHEDTHDILTKKAQMQQDRKEVLEAAATYEEVGDFAKAIDLLGNGGHDAKLLDLVQRLKPTDKELLAMCADFFKQHKKTEYVLQTLQKMGDTLSLLLYYVDLQEWEKAFQIGEEHPEYSEQIYLPYGNWLALNDRFDEAQVYYTKAGRPDEAIRILKVLAEASVIQHRYRLAAYYYWSLSKSALANFQKRSNISQKDERIKPFQVWKDFHDLAEIYYAYSHIFKYVEDPFTISLPAVLLNAAKFVLQKLNDRPVPPGISKNYTLYCLAKISSQLGCFKISKFAFEKLGSMRLPGKWQDTVDLASMQLRSKKNEDASEYLAVCSQCSYQNAAFNPKSAACVNCLEPFVFSFYSFDNLPLVRFVPLESISEVECENLINTEPPESSSGKDDLRKMLESLDRTGNHSYKPIEFNRQQLIGCDPNRVFIRKWGPMIPKEYYLLKSEDAFLVVCPACQQFFVEDEWNYQILLDGQCPFCRTKSSL